MEVEIHKVYRHFKGDLYLVEDIATHSETLERYVVYRALYGENRLWVRPYDMFTAEVTGKSQTHRFERYDLPSAKENR